MLRVAVLMTLLMVNAGGCLIPVPIAVFPARCTANGAELTFLDEDDQPIKQDGLLIVHRSFGSPVHKRWSEDRLVEIRDGTAMVPHRTKLGSIWLLPDSMSTLPHYWVLPGDLVYVMPLIRGFDIPFSDRRPHTNYDGTPLLGIGDHAGSHAVSVARSRDDNARAVTYYTFVLDRLRLEGYERPPEWTSGPYFCLPESDYDKARALVSEILGQLDERPTSQPAAEVRPTIQ